MEIDFEIIIYKYSNFLFKFPICTKKVKIDNSNFCFNLKCSFHLRSHRIPIDDVIGRTEPKPQLPIRRFRRIGSVNNIPTRNDREIGADCSGIGLARIRRSDQLSSNWNCFRPLPTHADDRISGSGDVIQQVRVKRTIGLANVVQKMRLETMN